MSLSMGKEKVLFDGPRGPFSLRIGPRLARSVQASHHQPKKQDPSSRLLGISIRTIFFHPFFLFHLSYSSLYPSVLLSPSSQKAFCPILRAGAVFVLVVVTLVLGRRCSCFAVIAHSGLKYENTACLALCSASVSLTALLCCVCAQSLYCLVSSVTFLTPFFPLLSFTRKDAGGRSAVRRHHSEKFPPCSGERGTEPMRQLRW